MLNGADHNATDNNGSTALHFSVMRKHYDLTQVLLQRRADPLLPNKVGCVHTHTHTGTYMHSHTHSGICMHSDTRTHIHALTHTLRHLHALTHIPEHTLTHTPKFTLTFLNTHTHTLSLYLCV